MSRLTYQKRDGNYSIRFDLGNLQQVDIKAMNKLGKLEDLEQDLGCPLDVVFKALKEGICIKLGDEYEQCNVEGWRIGVLFEEQCFIIHEMLFRTKLPLEDYGKTWFLKGEMGNEED